MNNEIFEYLIRQILYENCTPILGAGISFSSKCRNDSSKDDYHRTSNMIKKVAESLCERIKFGEGDKAVCDENECGYLEGCFVKKEVNNKALSKLSQKFIWEEADKENLQDRYKKLVNEVLHIEKFNNLTPTKAHFYLAFLAREGLITEVITTNYDTLLEKAYLKTFGFDDKEIDSILVQDEEKSYKENIVVRIFDRKSFARFSSLKSFERKDVDTDDESYVLKVYKINGCSFELKNRNSNFYEKILITSQQLQDWRERQWAADLFRYKLRSTSLLFIGYGSDEPQVLHTMQKVFEESKSDFANESNSNGSKNNENIFDKYSNIPIVSVYEKTPSFVHEYIARSFCESIGKNREWKKLILDYKVLNNQNKKKLSADELMQKIYLEILKKLLIEALDYSSHVANASFTAYIPNAEYILKEIKIDLKEKPEEFNLIFESKQYSENSLINPLPQIIKLFSSANGKKDVYLSIKHNKEGYAELLFILYVISGKNLSKLKIHKNWIELYEEKKRIYFSFNGKNIQNLANNEYKEGKNKEVDEEDKRCENIVVFLLGNYSIHNISSSSRIIKKESDSLVRTKVFSITWRDIFTDFNVDENISFEVIKKQLQKALLRPRKIAARERKSIKKRLEKIEVRE
ncbi:MAG: hypothetical protein PWP54_813 [Thermosipho sp. (in: thermotogales)]|nr:hypothetical protein [Thermosipho sp. (in: thermotogales)]